MSVGHDADLGRAAVHARHPLFVPGEYAGALLSSASPIGESLGASALRIAGGIFTKIADIGSDLMKIVFKIKEDDAATPA
jgi:K(+)-stimulated pyrophosphate-energized sodium pump